MPIWQCRKEKLRVLVDNGFTPLITNGSSNSFRNGAVAGIGVHAPTWELRDFELINAPQTNNCADV